MKEEKAVYTIAEEKPEASWMEHVMLIARNIAAGAAAALFLASFLLPEIHKTLRAIA